MVFDLGIGCGTLTDIQRATDAKGSVPALPITRIVTHSGEVREGDLFCALSGTRKGIRYAEEAKARGAVAVLADEAPNTSLPCLLVKDVPRALARWARLSLEESRARRVAITGSVGKTSTKNALFSLLSPYFRTHANLGNYNNLLGVSFTVLSMPKDTEILLCELGTNHPGEITTLSDIVKPSDAIITAIGTAHIGAFLSREGIFKEKCSVVNGMTEGRLFYPADEPLFDGFFHPRITPIPVLPNEKHTSDAATAWALGFALALGEAYKLPDSEIEKQLPLCEDCISGRKVLRAGGLLLLDDAYNASKESMLCAFRHLTARAEKRRVLVIGDILELGESSERIHYEVGKAAAKEADLIFVYGNYTDAYIRGIKRTDANAAVHSLKSSAPKDMAKEILPHLKKQDTLLCKSSHKAGAHAVLYALYSLLKNG